MANDIAPWDYLGGINNPNWLAERGGVSYSVTPGPPAFDPQTFYNPAYSPYLAPAPNNPTQWTYDAPGSAPPFMFNPVIPDQFAGVAGLDTPQGLIDFYGRYGASGPPPAVLADIDQTRRNVEDEERGRQTALGTLGGTRDDIFGRLTDFGDDPIRAAIGEMLQQRSTGELITPAQRAAAELELAQGSAIARNVAATGAAQRGVAGGGLQMGRDQAAQQQTAGQAISMEAQFDAINSTAQDRAITMLADFNTKGYAVESSYLGMLGQIDRDIASLESDVPLADIDFIAYESLEFGREVYAANEAYRNASLLAFEEANRYDFADIIDDVIEFTGAGGWQVAAGALDMVFGGDDDSNSRNPWDSEGFDVLGVL